MKVMQKIVIKIGSSTIWQGTQNLSCCTMSNLVQQIAELKKQGLQLILVSSGAIVTGRELLNPANFPSKQAFASIGQVKLMQTWIDLFSSFDLKAGQVLLTKDDFSNIKSHLTRDILNSLMEHVIPIINENDTITVAETHIGNNDNLAALVACLIGADTVILLTDQEGLFTSDPRLNADAKLIPLVSNIDHKIFTLASGSSTPYGTGGMTTKIQAAQLASISGIRTIIASSSHPNILLKLAEGKQIGTLFLENNYVLNH